MFKQTNDDQSMVIVCLTLVSNLPDICIVQDHFLYMWPRLNYGTRCLPRSGYPLKRQLNRNAILKHTFEESFLLDNSLLVSQLLT